MDEERIEVLRRRLEDAITSLPEGFYDTFNFTTTGMNLCHPVTLGLLAKVVGEMEGIGYVRIDVRLNQGKGLKFQPDIVGYRDGDGLQKNQPVIFVDFESPNSCDSRMTQYHLEQYFAWVKNPKHRAPYVIVTSLPDAEALTWELRYTSDLNREHKGNLKLMRDNPFQYWTRAWAEKSQAKSLQSRAGFSDVFFLNINRRKVDRFQLDRARGTTQVSGAK